MLSNITNMPSSLVLPALIINNLALNHWESIKLSERDLMPTPNPEEQVVNLQLFSTQSRVFVPYNPQTDEMGPFGATPNLQANLQVALIIQKLLEGNSATKLDLSTAPIPLKDYQSFIHQYKPSQLIDIQKQLAEQIMSPALSQTHRQAELRCVLALVYLQQNREDKARAQLKQAEKTTGFTLPNEFTDLYQRLKHPGRSHRLGR